jgi:hypothetical protein
VLSRNCMFIDTIEAPTENLHEWFSDPHMSLTGTGGRNSHVQTEIGLAHYDLGCCILPLLASM